MIEGVAFCPHPPVLVPEVARHAAGELDDLRAACRTAIVRIATPGRRLVLLGAGATSRVHAAAARGTFAGFGVPLEVALGGTDGTLELPLSLTVGAWLVHDALGPDADATGFSVGAEFWGSPIEDAWRAASAEADVALLVLGDGSARRSTAAPGYLDERAEGFDTAVADAMRGGVGAGFDSAHLDPDLAEELLVAGAPVWEIAGHALEARDYAAELLYDDAPYGVGYFVAAWT